MRDIIKKTGSIMLDLVFPPRCILCDSVMEPGKRGICSLCRGSIRFIREPVCMKCGRPCGEGCEFCSFCSKRRWYFDSGRCICEYDRIMQNSVTMFKYHGRQEYAEGYADIICEKAGSWIRKRNPEFFVPVPAHPERERRRGYNQAAVLARTLGKRMNIPVSETLIMRNKHTERQKDLNAAERRKNMENAFGPVSYCRIPYSVCLIDDIFTTGATLDECARVLREMGVKKIYFTALCAVASDEM